MKRNLLKSMALMSLVAIMSVGMAGCTKGGGSVATQPPASAGDTNPDGTASGDGTEVLDDKPEKITAMMTTIMTKENGLELVQQEYEKLTGIALEIVKPDHSQFYEKVNLAFASGDVTDVIELGSTYYPNYASYGALWDMTDAWANSTEPAKAITDETYVDAIRVDGRLYGFPMQKGNGTITYVRQDWLDELGVGHPTNYAEFVDMLRAFKSKGPEIIPITAQGLYNTETPYDIYLREFYQDARPDYIIKDGKFVDGMLEPEMVGALQRMREAYSEGLIDKEIVTNKTSTCRDKFYGNLVGAFNYWAGYWNQTLEENLVTSVPGAYISPIPAIKETQYIERVPTAMVITSQSKNDHEAIFKYFIQYSHDGAEGQMLFTHGVEGTHWKKEADGTTVALPQIENPDKVVEKAIYSPELTITKFDDPIVLDERVTNSLAMFQANSKIDTLPRTSDVIAATLPEINTIKSEYISKIVFGELTVEEGLNAYKQKSASFTETMISELNAQLQ